MVFPRQKYWSGLPCSSPEALPNGGTEPPTSALVCRLFTFEPPGNDIYLKTSENSCHSPIQVRTNNKKLFCFNLKKSVLRLFIHRKRKRKKKKKILNYFEVFKQCEWIQTSFGVIQAYRSHFVTA